MEDLRGRAGHADLLSGQRKQETRERGIEQDTEAISWNS